MERRRLRLLVVALFVGALGSACASASSSVIPVGGKQSAEGTPVLGSWLHTSVHMVLTDEVNFEESDSFNFDEVAPDEARERSSTLGFAVGYRYNLGPGVLGGSANVEAGLSVEHLGSGRYQRLDTTAEHGSQTSVYGDLRLRWLERSWGALYGVLGLGWSATHMSEALEFDLDNTGISSDVERYQHGIVGVAGAGVIFNLRDDLMLRAGLSGRSWSPALNGDDGNPQFDRTRMVLSLGLEWAP